MSYWADLPPGQVPVGIPPPGVVPNYEDPTNRTYQLIIVAAVFTPITLMAVAMRLYCKIKITRNFGWDDWSTIFATAGMLVYVALTLTIHRTAYGRHNWDVFLSELNDQQTKMVLAINVLSPVFFFFAKLSLFMLILRIFSLLKWLRWMAIGGIVFNALYSLAGVIGFLVMCIPPAGTADWTIWTAFDPRCASSVNLGYAQSGLNIFSDFYLLLVPIPAVVGLQIPTRRKIGVMAIFFTGIIACVASCYNLYAQVLLQNNQNDKLWYATPIYTVRLIELSCAITCSCIPAFAALYQHHGRGFFSLMSYFSRPFSSLRSDNSTKASLNTANFGPKFDRSIIRTDHTYTVDSERSEDGMKQELEQPYYLKSLPRQPRNMV